jgi:type IV pilus assembly protein PilE
MKKWLGLSLLELMVVLVIISILSAMALPVYSEHFTRAKRFEAEVALMRLSAALEQYYTVNNTYADATLGKLNFPGVIAGGRYQLVISEADSSSFMVQANPLTGKDSLCGELVLNSVGEKNVSGMGRVDECW